MGTAMESVSEAPRDAYWRMLEQGRFRFQRCARCSNAWLPPREDCPSCWSPEWQWEDASGRGRLVSWVIFHTAFHEVFEQRVPYNVAVVELDEGPRLITNIVNLPGSQEDVTDRPVSLAIETDHGRALPRFKLA
jgi:uncharacterized OB-fold protein